MTDNNPWILVAETDCGYTHKLAVPGGTLYRDSHYDSIALAFVPDPPSHNQPEAWAPIPKAEGSKRPDPYGYLCGCHRDCGPSCLKDRHHTNCYLA